ncbi:hypothetical protein BGX21_000668 [Mortierella sp. AD011]|nr:hypothetical protein BGX21_000668 [Mortierella sp. AD011]
MKSKAPVMMLSQQHQQQQQLMPQTSQSMLKSSSYSHVASLHMPSQKNSSFPRNISPHPQRQQHLQQQQHLRSPHFRKSSGNVGQKHQYYQQQQYDYHYNYDRNYREPDHPHNEGYMNHHNNRFYCNNHNNSSRRNHNSRHAEQPRTLALNPAAAATAALAHEEASASATVAAEVVSPSSITLAASSSSLPSTSSSPSSSSSTPAVNITPVVSVPTIALTVAAVSGGSSSDAHNSDPEPALGDVEKYLQMQQQRALLQPNNRSNAKENGPRKRSQLGSGDFVGLRRGVPSAPISQTLQESDNMSSNSSMRESPSDYDTFFGTEEEGEGEGSFPVSSDSNNDDTDYSSSVLSSSALDDPLALDRQSRRKRSMQRLIAKNKTLKSSLAQAKADLATERQNRAMIDQIYLKIRKELNMKLDAEEIKVANLTAKLEAMTEEMKVLQEEKESLLASSKSALSVAGSLSASSSSSSTAAAAAATSTVSNLSSSSSAYRIGYDNSNYSLTSGLAGGLVLHHSNFLHGHDEEDEFFTPSNFVAVKEPSTSSSLLPPPPPPPSVATPLNLSTIQSCDDEEKSPSSLSFDEKKNDEKLEHDKEDEKKVTFLAAPLAIPPRTRSPSPLATSHTTNSAQKSVDAESREEEEEEDDDDDDDDDSDDDDDAPCTMMEILIKKQQSHSAEDEAQDPPADANETFDSMAHKFLYQALHAKFTAARTILQLDDLLLKYDASSEDLVLVLAQECMKWWEDERIKVGGPMTGGWGTGSVLMPETGDRVSAKVAVETRFKSIYIPLLMHYVASHQEQRVLLDKLEATAKTNDHWMKNHVGQLMTLYKFDVLDADAILEWWQLLKDPQGVSGHSNGLRTMSSKFVAWLQDAEDDSDSDDDDDDDDSEDDDDDDDEEEEEDEDVLNNNEGEDDGQCRIVGLDLLSSPRDVLHSLDADLAKAQAEKEELMVIGSDDDDDDDRVSTTSSLERIEECERKRRISFCTNNVIITQNNACPSASKKGSASTIASNITTTTTTTTTTSSSWKDAGEKKDTKSQHSYLAVNEREEDEDHSDNNDNNDDYEGEEDD